MQKGDCTMKNIFRRILSVTLALFAVLSVFSLNTSGKSETVQINISVEGAGKATKSLTAEKGDKVSLSVKADELARFIGWYENGELVSEKETYTFKAKADRDLLAKFTTMQSAENIHIFMTYKRKTFNINEHLNLPEKGNYKITYRSSDEEVAEIDKDGNVKTTGTGEGVITYTVKLENGKEITQSIGIKVVFTPRQWFIYIFLFGWLWY